MMNAVVSGFLVLVVFSWGSGIEAAEQYPVKPITFIVGVEAGADGDIMTRPLAQKASPLLGQPMMVVNKPGAGSSLAYREVHDAKPDGYTIGMSFGTIITNKLQGISPYDYRDFTVLGLCTLYTPIVVASTKNPRPFKTMEEVISFAKAHPGEASVATSGVGQMLWVATMAFLEGTGLKFNIIPQPGAGGFVATQVAGGHTDLAILYLAAVKGQIEAGNVRPLAVFGDKRFPAPYQNVPSLKEFGYDVFVQSSMVIIAPPKLPRDAADKLAKAFETAAADPEYQKFVAELNAVPFHLPPQRAVQFLNEQREVYRKIMGKAGILKEK